MPVILNSRRQEPASPKTCITKQQSALPKLVFFCTEISRAQCIAGSPNLASILKRVILKKYHSQRVRVAIWAPDFHPNIGHRKINVRFNDGRWTKNFIGGGKKLGRVGKNLPGSGKKKWRAKKGSRKNQNLTRFATGQLCSPFY